MKLKRKIIALAMAATFTISMVSTAFADTPPHLMYGTEKTYGEESTQHKPLYQDEYDPYSNWGSQYTVLPKTDTFSFERENSEFDDNHNITITWWAATVYDADGKASLSLEGTRDMKTEKFIYGKEYPVYPDEVRDKIISQEEHTDSMGVSGYYNEYNSKTTNRNEPIIILMVEDHDLNSYYWWVYQVVDNWQVPDRATDISTSTSNTNSENNHTGKWANDSKGWWIQNADGTYLTNAWYQSPESGLWYYMGANGYMLTNTTTPDGYTVNADGVWVQ